MRKSSFRAAAILKSTDDGKSFANIYEPVSFGRSQMSAERLEDLEIELGNGLNAGNLVYLNGGKTIKVTRSTPIIFYVCVD